jgi:hypothetical protein
MAMSITEAVTGVDAKSIQALTKREYFAAMAMQGLLAGQGTERKVYHESVASEAVKSADALLNELSKPKP